MREKVTTMMTMMKFLLHTVLELWNIFELFLINLLSIIFAALYLIKQNMENVGIKYDKVIEIW